MKQWLIKNHKTIAVHLDFCGVILEAQLSSPVMGLFANLLGIEQSLLVLDRFILHGEQGLIKIIKQTFASQKQRILKHKEPFELQIYLARQIYLDAIKEQQFLPQPRRVVKL